MNGHELYPWGEHLECSCGEWAMFPQPGVEDAWAEHAGVPFDDEDDE